MLNSRDLLDRRIRAAVREYDSLERKRYKIIKLDRPIQRGWRRFYVLAPHALRRPDHSILEAILGVIGPVIMCHNPNFVRRHGRRKRLVEMEQPLRPIPVGHREWDKFPESWRRYFSQEYAPFRQMPRVLCWVFRQPSLFELKVERNWLWYFCQVDPAVESRLSELERWIASRSGWERYAWLKGRPNHWHSLDRDSDPQRVLARQHRSEIAHAIKNFPEVDPAASARRTRLSFRPQIFLLPA